MSTTLKSVISGMCALAIFGSVGAIELNEREKKNLEGYRWYESTLNPTEASIVPVATENVDKVAQLMGSLEDGKVAAENSLKVIDFKGKKYIVFNLDRPSDSKGIYVTETTSVSPEDVRLLAEIIGKTDVYNEYGTAAVLLNANTIVTANTIYIYGQLTK